MKQFLFLLLTLSPLNSLSQEALLRCTSDQVVKIALSANKGNCSNFTTTARDSTSRLSWDDYHMHSKFSVFFDKNGISNYVVITPDNTTMLKGYVNALNQRMTKVKSDRWIKQMDDIVYKAILFTNKLGGTDVVFTYEIE